MEIIIHNWGNVVVKKLISLVAMISALISIHTTIYASWGWEWTDDPKPYYHQERGKWYLYDDAKVFMVQIDNQTYKYVFDYHDKLISGWVTYMPMRLP